MELRDHQRFGVNVGRQTPIVAYNRALQVRLADEIQRLPPGAALERAMLDAPAYAIGRGMWKPSKTILRNGPKWPK
ncbi:hypothetical protein [Microvirga sp. TS319]|uniref:hypothetical protein n=1 Tax=Microvirga sp. TS319 TaxID=3241165 RepID=UPI003519FB1B